MNDEVRTWDPRGALAPSDHVLLEASAGTGKTYATEGLVVRLVAEYGVPIDKILVITFTNAATAELRARIRARLESALDALGTGTVPSDDEAIASLLDGSNADRERRRASLEDALAAYDQAPISTIHGFCQRTLGELALEADQDPDLTVVSEALSVTEQLVADALATVFATATAAELRALEDMGWTAANLKKVTKAMTGPTAPEVEPAAADSAGIDPIACTRRWWAEVAAVRAWLGTAEGVAARAALENDAKIKGKGKKVGGVGQTTFSKNWGLLERWLDLRGPAKGHEKGDPDVDWIEKTWSQTYLDAKWKGGDDQSFEGLEVYRRVTALRDLRPTLWSRPLADFARRVRAAFEAELTRRAWLTYDGMLSKLAERLDGADGAGLAAAIRARYDVAIVDEFQDTDGAQWGILREVFHRTEPDDPRRFYAVGDPKQAIYSFRNANLGVYLDAAKACTPHRLATNHRSDKPLVDALNHVWGYAGAPFEHEDIKYERVDAKNEGRIENLPPVETDGGKRPRFPLELRLFDGTVVGLGADDSVTKPVAEKKVAELCAAECRVLLDKRTAIGPRDLAVLVRTHKQGEMVRLALRRHGIPAVSANKESIFQSDAVAWLRALLDALAAPTREQGVKWLALTPLVNWSPAQLTQALSAPTEGDDDEKRAARRAWEELRQRLISWADRFGKLGVFRVFDAFSEAYDVFPRLVGSEYGERGATDLRHLLELCHVEERRTRPGPRGLAQWLERMAAEEPEEEGERVQRLESDAEAVQIVTVHACKGLQYPSTLVPFAWGTDTPTKEAGQPLRYDGQSVGTPARTVLNLEVKGAPTREAAKRAVDDERRREDMRLLYVALTRARHHVVVWTSATAVKKPGAIHRLLGQGGEQDDAAVLGALTADPAKGVGWLREQAPVAPTELWNTGTDGTAADEAPLEAAVWPADRPLGAIWTVASFSSLSAGKGGDVDGSTLHEVAAVEHGHEGDDADAEPPDHSAVVEDGFDVRAWVSADASLLDVVPGAPLPGGTGNGKWLHAVLEHIDFGGDAGTPGRGKRGEPEAVVKEQARVRGITKHLALVRELLPGWLDAPLDVPLPPGGPGSLPAGFSLRQIPVGDRLDELQFDLRLGAGTGWAPSMRTREGDYTGRIDPDAVRLALGAALEDEAFGGRGWLDELLKRKGPDGKPRRILPAIAGLMTGSIDLAFRVGGEGTAARYYIVDYKSNVVRGSDDFRAQLGELAVARDANDVGWKLRRASYTRPLLTWAMAHGAYPLQALIYTVALHRLLCQRLGTGYRYDTHIGGHLYLFLRGMDGTRSRVDGLPLGVYGDRWPAKTVIGLDAALAGESLAAVQAAMNAHGESA